MNRPTVRGDAGLLRRLVVEARPDWPGIAVVHLLGMLAAPLALLAPVPLALTVDSVLGDKPLPGFVAAVLPTSIAADPGRLLVAMAILLVVVAVLVQVQDVTSTVVRTAVGERMLLRFRSRLFDRAQRLSLLHHDRVGTADTTYRIEFDATALPSVALDTLVAVLTAATTLVGMIVVIARLDGALAMVALAIAPVLFVTAHGFRGRLRARSRGVKGLESGALAVVQEVLTGLRVVRAFGQEPREHDRFRARAGDAMQARVRLTQQEGLYGATVGTTVAVGSALVLVVGVHHVQLGTLTLGNLLLVMTYLTQLYAPLKTMARRAGRLQSDLASAERAFALLDEPPAVPDHGTRSVGRAGGAIAFAHVTFGYEAGTPVLRDVDLAIPAGSRVGIIGPTGVGKTTLLGLLLRLHDPDEGTITLDGVDLRAVRLADLRRQFGVVLQEPVLFSRSIAENIAYARPDASDAEVVAAARAADADAFVGRLPDGYATLVGERGMTLSGGERQRIALARAFLRDAPVLVLDEPTSAVDTDTEASILAAVHRLMAGRTTLVVAHRRETLAGCDLLLHVDAGGHARLAPSPRSADQPPGAGAFVPALPRGLPR